jgi:hypothetical protein
MIYQLYLTAKGLRQVICCLFLQCTSKEAPGLKEEIAASEHHCASLSEVSSTTISVKVLFRLKGCCYTVKKRLVTSGLGTEKSLTVFTVLCQTSGTLW